MSKRILIITYYWPPAGGAGVQRWLKLTKYLPAYGIEPIVLTVDTKYASYPIEDPTLVKEIDPNLLVYKTKSFEILKLFSLLAGKKNVPYGGFSNVNTKTLLSKVSRFIRGNFFIPDARIGWNRFAYKKAQEIIEKYGIHTVLTTSPPHSTQLIGLKLKKKLNINWIVDINDPWTDIYYYEDLYPLGFVKKIDKKYETSVITESDRVITNCNSNMELFAAKLPSADRGKFSVVPNGFDPAKYKKYENFPVNTSEFVFAYIGTITEKYEPAIVFKTILRLQQTFKDIRFKLLFVGTVSPLVKEEIKKQGIEKITQYVGPVSYEKAVAFAHKSVVLINIFPKTKYDKGVPGKVGEYLASKRPVISIGPRDGDSAQIIEQASAGKSFTRNMEKELFQYISELVKKWKKDPQKLLNDNKNLQFYSMEHQAGKVAEIVHNC